MTAHDHDPVALVTGGSRGIGRAVVQRLVRDGYVVAFCHTARGAEQAARVVAENGDRAVAVEADVTHRGEVRALVQRVRSELGVPDVLVTSAGIVRDSPLALMSDDHWDEVIDVNLSGTYNVCRTVVFEMIKRKRGSIVNISSVAGVSGNAGQTNYSAAKAGIIGFSKALAKEVGRYGIRVNVIAPGFIETEMTNSLSPTVRQRAIDNIPVGRFGAPEEVADMVGYLASASYVHGAVLPIDGGIVL